MERLFGDISEVFLLIVAFIVLLASNIKKKPLPKGDEKALSSLPQESSLAISQKLPEKAKISSSPPEMSSHCSAPLCQPMPPSMVTGRKPSSGSAVRLTGRQMILSYEIFSVPLCLRGPRR